MELEIPLGVFAIIFNPRDQHPLGNILEFAIFFFEKQFQFRHAFASINLYKFSSIKLHLLSTTAKLAQDMFREYFRGI